MSMDNRQDVALAYSQEKIIQQGHLPLDRTVFVSEATSDTGYYQTLLAEKEKEIQKLQKMLDQSSKKKEQVVNRILDQPKVTHSATRTYRSAYSQRSNSRSPVKDDRS